MVSVEQQLKDINSKDELIKWLVNAYYVHSWKIVEKNGHKQVAAEERQQVKAKADEIMRGE